MSVTTLSRAERDLELCRTVLGEPAEATATGSCVGLGCGETPTWVRVGTNAPVVEVCTRHAARRIRRQALVVGMAGLREWSAELSAALSMGAEGITWRAMQELRSLFDVVQPVLEQRLDARVTAEVASAPGAAATHAWVIGRGFPVCSVCKTAAWNKAIREGRVPVCGEPCDSTLDEGHFVVDGKCTHCQVEFPPADAKTVTR